MTITMQPDVAHRARARVTAVNTFERVVDDRLVRVSEIRRDEAVLQHEFGGRLAETFNVNARPMRKRLQSAHRMDAPHEPSDPAQGVRVVEFRRASALPWKQREAKAATLVQCFAGSIGNGCDDRYFARRELARIGMLFQYRFVAPALRAVELGDQDLVVFAPHLVHAIFKAVQRILAAVAAVAAALDGIEYQVGNEGLVGVSVRHGSGGSSRPTIPCYFRNAGVNRRRPTDIQRLPP